MCVTDLRNKIKQHYPNASTEFEFIQQLRNRLVNDYQIDVEKLLLVTSICADDIIPIRQTENTLSVVKGALKREFLGPFSMGGLAGLPYSGLTGMLTVGHHIPAGGSVLIIYGPHIGISAQGELGKLQRPGQCHESVACGALSLAVAHFQSSPDYQPTYDDDDTEQMTLERRLMPFRAAILAAEHPLQAATEYAYTTIHELIHRYLERQKDQFHCEYVGLAGGIIINTSEGEDYFDWRHFSVLRIG